MTVTRWPGGKSCPSTMNVALGSPELWFMHSVWLATSLVPQTVCGAIGGRPVELPELVSEAPRMTPPTTRAAPTEIQPTQARCVLTHRRAPDPRSGRDL